MRPIRRLLSSCCVAIVLIAAGVVTTRGIAAAAADGGTTAGDAGAPPPAGAAKAAGRDAGATTTPRDAGTTASASEANAQDQALDSSADAGAIPGAGEKAGATADAGTGGTGSKDGGSAGHQDAGASNDGGPLVGSAADAGIGAAAHLGKAAPGGTSKPGSARPGGKGKPGRTAASVKAATAAKANANAKARARARARRAAKRKAHKARKAKKALKVLDAVHEYGQKTVRRLKRVEKLLRQGNVAAAKAELARAKRAASNAVDTTVEFAEEEELTAVDYVVRTLLTLGIALLAFLLIWALTVLMRRLVTRAVGAEAMGGGLRWAFRLLMLVLSVGVLATSTWLVLRMVWKVRISGARFYEVLSQPLFAFEGRPVTPLSMLFFLMTLGAIVILSRGIRRLLEQRVLPRFSQDIGVQHAFSAILHYLIIFLGLLLSLEVLGVGASTVAIVAGVVGLGIGFGMQHIINNFLSGFILFFERPVKVGDIVDVSGMEGRVERIQARATTIVTRDHATVIVPNSDFVQGKVTNLSYPDSILRTRVRVGVAYSSDVERVRQVLLSVAEAHPEVLRIHPCSVQLVDFADSSINFDLIFWVKEILNRDRIRSEIRFSIAHAFRKHGVQIPFPQRDTHLFPSPELAALLDREGKEEE